MPTSDRRHSFWPSSERPEKITGYNKHIWSQLFLFKSDYTTPKGLQNGIDQTSKEKQAENAEL